MSHPFIEPMFMHPSCPDFKNQRGLDDMNIEAVCAVIPRTVGTGGHGLEDLDKRVLLGLVCAPRSGYTGKFPHTHAFVEFTEWRERDQVSDADAQDDDYDCWRPSREVWERIQDRFPDGGVVSDADDRLKDYFWADLLDLAEELKPGWRKPSLSWRPVKMHVGSKALRAALKERPAEIIPGLIGPGLITVLAGDKSTGKSALLSGVSCCILTGDAWLPNGPPTKKGRVLIIATEGVHRSIHDFVAQCLSRGLDPDEVMDRGFMVVEGAFQLDTAPGIAALVNVLKQFSDTFGGYPDLLAIDTVRKSMHGSVSDERDVAAFIRNLEENVTSLGIAVMLLAHTSKDSKDGSTKGSNDWENGADYVLRISGKVRDNKTEVLFEKVKTGPDGHAVKIDFDIQNVPDAGDTIVAMPRRKPVHELEVQKAVSAPTRRGQRAAS